MLEYPIKYLEKYISDNFYEDIALYTNMREVKDKGRSLETTSDEIKLFFGVSILMGIYGHFQEFGCFGPGKWDFP